MGGGGKAERDSLTDRSSADHVPSDPTAMAIDDDQLVAEALAARAHAYAPYSMYLVGAALLAADGTVYRGCNVENASYPATICAERTALVSAVAAGRQSFLTIAVVVDGTRPAPPCGICRQMLSELAPRLRVIMATTNGQRAISDLATLLPAAFSSADLAEP